MDDFKLFRYSMIIKERHLDTFSHVNNATYLELLEEARWEFLNDRGLDLNRIHQLGFGPVVLEFTIQFLKEIGLRQTIVIESQMMSWAKKIGTMRQDIFDEQAVLCCKAKMTFGIIDFKSRKLILPSPLWLEAIGMD